MTAKQLLQSALDDISTFGWVQGHYGTSETGYCLVGALGHRIHSYTYDSYQDATRAVRKAIGYPVASLIDWNDLFGRTKEDVVLILQKAIDLVEEVSGAPG